MHVTALEAVAGRRAAPAALGGTPLADAVLAGLGEGVVVADRQGSIIYRNAAVQRILPEGVDLADFIAKLGENGLWPHREDATTDRSALAWSRTGDAVVLTVQFQREDGKRIDIETTTTAIPGLDGAPELAVTVFRDVSATTERDQLRDQFLATIAHDVRSPLATVKGYAQTLVRRADRANDGNLQRIGHEIDAQVTVIDRLLDDILDARRIDQGKFELNRRRLNLTSFLHETLEAMRDDARYRRHELRVELPKTPVMGWFDAGLLRRVLENLVGNAVKYSPKDHAIDVQLTATRDQATLTIQDHGIGIPTDSLPYLFDQFYRAPNARTRSRGQGLGLYVAKSLIEAHQGAIHVTSVIGEGATFTIELPLTQP